MRKEGLKEPLLQGLERGGVSLDLAPLTCAKSTPMALRSKLYSACVTSCMVYGSEIWALTVENQRRLERTERQMLKRICKLKERISSEELRQKAGRGGCHGCD